MIPHPGNDPQLFLCRLVGIKKEAIGLFAPQARLFKGRRNLGNSAFIDGMGIADNGRLLCLPEHLVEGKYWNDP